jgi:hypothetical protein
MILSSDKTILSNDKTTHPSWRTKRSWRRENPIPCNPALQQLLQAQHIGREGFMTKHPFGTPCSGPLPKKGGTPNISAAASTHGVE